MAAPAPYVEPLNLYALIVDATQWVAAWAIRVPR
jgi:hypothetical protein